MSQTPNMPPGAFPPNSAFPPGGQPPRNPYLAPPKTTNGPAIASVICGALGCIPFVTSLLAIVLGIVGINKSKDSRVGGKGMAITGLLLGIVGLLCWGGISAGAMWGYQKVKPIAEATSGFIEALSNGDTAKAAQFSELSQDQLEEISTELKSLGKLKQLNRTSSDGNMNDFHLVANATFDNGTRTIEVRMAKVGDLYKVKKFDIRSGSPTTVSTSTP